MSQLLIKKPEPFSSVKNKDLSDSLSELNSKLSTAHTDHLTNLNVDKINDRVHVSGIVVLNASTGRFDLPYPVVGREVLFPTIGTTTSFGLSGYGYGSIASGGKSCYIGMNTAVTYAMVNFSYRTNL